MWCGVVWCGGVSGGWINVCQGPGRHGYNNYHSCTRPLFPKTHTPALSSPLTYSLTLSFPYFHIHSLFTPYLPSPHFFCSLSSLSFVFCVSTPSQPLHTPSLILPLMYSHSFSSSILRKSIILILYSFIHVFSIS